MSFKVRKILVAVADGSARKVVDRIAELVASSKVQVELFSVVRPVPPVFGMIPVDDEQLTRALVDAKRRELERLVKRLRARGVAVACAVVADFSVSDAIVRRVLQSKADLVAIEAHKHNFLARLFMTQNDYDLIRQCPVPLLIVKGMPRASKSPVVAALDPWHAEGKPKSLDATIIGAARELARLTGAAVHSAHVYSSLVSYIPDGMFSPVAFPISPSEEKKYASSIKRRFKALNVKYKIAARHSHLRLGDAAFILPTLAKSLKAQMLVMGAISRSALQRVLIGSTAERVLDALPCDILIVKPIGSSTQPNSSTGAVRSSFGRWRSNRASIPA